jgi:hypothetical protein
MNIKNGDFVSPNDQVNRDAAKDVPTPETTDGGSGSTYCSPIFNC